jgi:hypothetical protein
LNASKVLVLPSFRVLGGDLTNSLICLLRLLRDCCAVSSAGCTAAWECCRVDAFRAAFSGLSPDFCRLTPPEDDVDGREAVRLRLLVPVEFLATWVTEVDTFGLVASRWSAIVLVGINKLLGGRESICSSSVLLVISSGPDRLLDSLEPRRFERGGLDNGFRSSLLLSEKF